jgi:hypothetical protein
MDLLIAQESSDNDEVLNALPSADRINLRREANALSLQRDDDTWSVDDASNPVLAISALANIDTAAVDLSLLFTGAQCPSINGTN